jgi:universal stress protein E
MRDAGRERGSRVMDIRNILVAVETRDDARYALEKGRALARVSGAALHVVRVVYEGVADLGAAFVDASTDLKSFILRAAEEELEEWIATPGGMDAESLTLWNPRIWEGVLHAAERVGADLIVKGASVHPRFGGVVRTPDDWNLLRHATVPAMLVKSDAWQKEPAVLCALDAFDDAHEALNVNLLRTARDLAELLGGSLDLVMAYPLFEPWVGEMGAAQDYDELKARIEQEIRDRIAHLSNRARVRCRHVMAEEGRPVQVIARIAEDDQAALVVVGTHARSGVPAVLLGNTSERLLHALQTDVVTVGAPAMGT